MLLCTGQTRHAPGRSAFSLLETLFASGFVALVSVGLIQLLWLSGQLSRASREQLQALQILNSRLESVRAHGWDQLRTAPASFCETNELVFHGSITVQTNAFSESYGNHLLKVTARANWTSEGKQRTAELSTCVSFYGLSSSP